MSVVTVTTPPESHVPPDPSGALRSEDRAASPDGAPRWSSPLVLWPVLVSLAFATLCCWVLSENISQVFYRTFDEVAYVRTTMLLQSGIPEGDWAHAFSGPVFGYGFGYFLYLAVFTLPAQILQHEQLWFFLMRFSSVALVPVAIVQVLRLAEIASREPVEGEARRGMLVPPAAYALGAWIVATLPGLHNMLIHVHPEVLMIVFDLAGVLLVLRWRVTGSWLLAAVAGVLFGAAIATKTSALIMLGMPGVIFLHALIHRALPWKALALFVLACGVTTLGTAYLLTDPRGFLLGDWALRDFRQQFQSVSSLLQRNMIAEFDGGRALAPGESVTLNWLTHPYSHSFAPWPVAYVLLLGVLLPRAIREWRGRASREREPIASMLLFTHAFFAGYHTLFTTSIAGYFFLPTMTPIMGVSACMAIAALWRWATRTPATQVEPTRSSGDRLDVRAWLYRGAVALGVALVAWNSYQCWRIADRTSLGRMRNYNLRVDDYRGVSAFLQDINTPKGSLLSDVEIPLSVTNRGLRHQPARRGNAARTSQTITSNFQLYGLVESVGEQGKNADVIVLYKRHAGTPAAMQNLSNLGLGLAYEDNFAVVMTRWPVARRLGHDLVSLREAMDERSALHAGREVRLAWGPKGAAPLWENFRFPVDLRQTNAIELDLDVRTLPVQGASPFIRLTFFGMNAIDRFSRKPMREQWDINLAALLKPGRQTLVVPRSAFRFGTGLVQWGYVTGMVLGGEAPEGCEIVVYSINAQ